MKLDRLRVVYSFPHKLGADRICYTAWQQVHGLAAAGAELTVFPGVLHRPVPEGVRTEPTLAWGKLRIPYRLLGKMRALALHDRIVARRLERLAGKVDVVHAWPVGALETLTVAKRLGIPTVLERPNTHTRFAFDTVKKEFDRLGMELPLGDEYYPRADVLRKEEAEYQIADYLLCPSEFVLKTFLDRGFERTKLLRHVYGFDERVFHPDLSSREKTPGLKAIFVGVCAVRKGVHFALEAWLRSPASRHGTFLIAGSFLPSYQDKLASMLSHPSVKVLGHRNDVPELMRASDILMLPSIEEGSPLVVQEALGSGCVPLTSDVCLGASDHMATALIHPAGDVDTLADQLTMLHEDRALLEKLRAEAIRQARQHTWQKAGERLLEAYREATKRYRNSTIQCPALHD